MDYEKIIAELKQEIQELKLQVKTDYLTGLYNRLGAEELINEKISNKDSRGCLLLIDINDLKLINDNYGHQKGDVVLCTLAEVLKNAASETDVAARIGGDEFVIYYSQVNNADDIKNRVQDLYEKLNKEQAFNAVSFSIGVGVAVVNQHDDFSSTYGRADMMMYRSKKNKTKIEQNRNNT